MNKLETELDNLRAIHSKYSGLLLLLEKKVHSDEQKVGEGKDLLSKLKDLIAHSAYEIGEKKSAIFSYK